MRGVMAQVKEGEKLSSFIARFMPKREEHKSPERRQRLALGYTEAREQSRKEKRS